jgi:glycerophosphoryl diester phosphodiesterase
VPTPGSLLKIGHRGASGTTPELTRAAFLRALELGVDMIEFDIQLTKDGYLVVIHDHELERTTNGSGAVRDHTLAELKQLDAGAWFDQSFAGETILTLEEVIEIVGRRAMLNVEVKSPPGDWSNTALKTVAVLTHAGILGTTVLSCFQMQALEKVRELSPAARIGVLWHQPEFDDAWRWARELAAWSFHPWSKVLTAEGVAEAHQRGLRVLTWTVNDPEEIGQVAAMGVDGIMSDFPERLLHVGRRVS